jgi:hypothetical protein
MLDYCTVPDTKEWHESDPLWAKLQRDDKGSLKSADIAFAVAIAAAARAPSLPYTPPRSLAEKFKEQADKWGLETAHISSPTQMMAHPSYQAILGMANDNNNEVVRLMLNDLQEHRRAWFWALSYLTQENPIKASDVGKLDKMIKSWVEWGRQKGLL